MHRPTRLIVTGLAGAGLWTAGCQVLGPTSVSAGRSAYNEVIARTNAEQLLLTLVRMRYGDPIGLLSVTSVTASLKFSATAGAQFGVGPQSNYSGNLVPLSAGVSYEDNPTISYVPVTGQAFLKDWLSPMSLELLVLLLDGGVDDATLVPWLVAGMNDLQSPGRGGRDGFLDAARLLVQLHRAGVIFWGRQQGSSDSFELSIREGDEAHRVQIDELLRLLDIRRPQPSASGVLRVPLVTGLRQAGDPALAIRTNSMAQLLVASASAIEVPPEHVEAGVVAPTTIHASAESTFGQVNIKSGRDAPRQAVIAVQHRGWWFWIDDTDLESKRHFQRLEMLFLMRLAEGERGSQTAPVLTIPVS
ncbi:MAG: hypothetical protein KF724_02580 [Phycisphaeraceae bacterium]|nr:hypothetical protein [Phycisphaeraceae bacterium]